MKPVSYPDLLDSDQAVAKVVANVWKYGFGLVDCVPPDMEGNI